jgi:hypothetical protein
MKWLLLLTILSGYSGSSTTTANFDSKEACEAAGKSLIKRFISFTGIRLLLCGHAARHRTRNSINCIE